MTAAIPPDGYELAATRPQCALPDAPYHVWNDADGAIWTEFHRIRSAANAAKYLLRFPGVADFTLDADGAAAVCHPVRSVQPTTLDHLFYTQIAPLLSTRAGRPVFHGSAVTLAPEQGAIAFLGRSGMGKSTLAAAFGTSGAQFLTDDTLGIAFQDSAPVVLPGPPSVRLWQDSHSSVVPQAKALVGSPFSDKSRVLAADSALIHWNRPVPLHAVFLLENVDADTPTARPLGGSLAARAWLDNSFVLDTQAPDQLIRAIDTAAKLARMLPVHALDFPRDYAQLKRVQQFVSDLVATIRSV